VSVEILSTAAQLNEKSPSETACNEWITIKVIQGHHNLSGAMRRIIILVVKGYVGVSALALWLAYQTLAVRFMVLIKMTTLGFYCTGHVCPICRSLRINYLMTFVLNQDAPGRGRTDTRHHAQPASVCSVNAHTCTAQRLLLAGWPRPLSPASRPARQYHQPATPTTNTPCVTITDTCDFNNSIELILARSDLSYVLFVVLKLFCSLY